MSLNDNIHQLLTNSRLRKISGPGIDIETTIGSFERRFDDTIESTGVLDIDTENKKYYSREFKNKLDQALENGEYSPSEESEFREKGYIPGREISSNINDFEEELPEHLRYESSLEIYEEESDFVNYKLVLEPREQSEELNLLAKHFANLRTVLRTGKDPYKKWEVRGLIDRDIYDEIKDKSAA
jgi:hypothetical protein